jgi:hypothetical protein
MQQDRLIFDISYIKRHNFVKQQINKVGDCLMSSRDASPIVDTIIEMSLRPINIPKTDIVKRQLENGMIPIIS